MKVRLIAHQAGPPKTNVGGQIVGRQEPVVEKRGFIFPKAGNILRGPKAKDHDSGTVVNEDPPIRGTSAAEARLEFKAGLMPIAFSLVAEAQVSDTMIILNRSYPVLDLCWTAQVQ